MNKNKTLETIHFLENIRSHSIETQMAYEMRLKAIIDEEARLSDVREKSLEEGIEQGIEKGIEIGVEQSFRKVAMELLALNIDIETIQKSTGLTIDEIEALKANM